MKLDVYYIESPLQLLGALAAKKQMQHKAVLIVRLAGGNRQTSDDQIKQLIDPDEWYKVHITTKKRNKYLNTLLNMYCLVKYHRLYKNMIGKYFYGEFRNLEMNVLGRALAPNDMVLLDDGAFTIVAQLDFIQKSRIPYNLNVKEASLYAKLFRLNLHKLIVPNLFSFFYLDESLVDGQVNYCRPQNKKEIEVDTGQVYFFGSKFSEAGILRLDDELNVLKKVCSELAGKQIFYVPHRDEKPEKLEKVKAYGASILDLGKPAEVYFDETDKMPFLVISCYSTVLYTCYARFSNVRLQAYDVLPYIDNPTIKDQVINVYRYYDSIGISREKVE